MKRLLAALTALALYGGAASFAAVPLPQLTIDTAQTSVSGLSAGGFMAVQMHVAYSATFKKGAGIVAGGPFYCAEGSIVSATGRCMTHSTSIPVAGLVSTTNSWAGQGLIDATSNLAGSKVYLFSGSIDSTVKPAVMDDLRSYYKSYLPDANVVYRKDIAAEHSMVTDDYGNACSVKSSPYINDCNFDLAGAILQQIYGTLNPRNSGSLSGTFTEFDQSAFISGHGMAVTAWVYVPQSCAAGATCRIHLVLHGCKQNTADIGQQYVRNTGYNRWADSNNIVLLYPQTSQAATNSCWDWWGYDSANYARKSGPQMAAIKAMIDRVSSDGGTPPPPPPPAASCSTASNYTHTLAGRAHVGGWFTYANGSNQNMGLWNVFIVSTLKNTGPNYYVIGVCN